MKINMKFLNVIFFTIPVIIFLLLGVFIPGFGKQAVMNVAIFIILYVSYFALGSRISVFNQGRPVNAVAISILLGLASFAASFFMSHLGLIYDEPTVAYGGHLVAYGYAPYVDFGVPNGPVLYYSQALGSLLFPYSAHEVGFSGSLLNGITVFAISLVSLKKMRVNVFTATLIALTTHLAFFGMTGILWYNQFAALWCSIAVIYAVYISIIKKVAFNVVSIFTISILVGLTLMSKQDLGLLTLVSIPVLVTGFGIGGSWSRVKWGILSFIMPLAMIALTALFFQWRGAAPLEWFNYGQAGYDSRLIERFVSYFYSGIGRVALGEFTIIRFLSLFMAYDLLSSFIRSRNSGDGPVPGDYAIALAALSACGVNVVITFSSGKNFGYIIPSLTPLFLLIFICYVMLNATKRKRLCAVLVSVLLISSLYAANDIKLKYIGSLRNPKKYYGIENIRLRKFYVTDKKTKVFFDEYDILVRRLHNIKGSKVTALTHTMNFNILFTHPSVEIECKNRPLVQAIGSYLKRSKEGLSFQMLQESRPELYILLSQKNDSGYVYPSWEAMQDLVKEHIQKSYDLALREGVNFLGNEGVEPKYYFEVYIRKGLRRI